MAVTAPYPHSPLRSACDSLGFARARTFALSGHACASGLLALRAAGDLVPPGSERARTRTGGREDAHGLRPAACRRGRDGRGLLRRAHLGNWHPGPPARLRNRIAVGPRYDPPPTGADPRSRPRQAVPGRHPLSGYIASEPAPS
ncbi:hypothetical protein SVEN_6906 [Streptomyces venezuelae ATCC 10712]|uniref:Uncharacterized protein n=1 Tax=Streptomyces venezuelae (strain ATCC 10712 / CBS 650.69 / DSM 40230 / JCM 4526 / NBRC 13096 / PD 04745) TaxID=953739 RepID=F2RJ66_STRVP|nr:hypothetical protein SVEN_6906 [Streptomyces venezuelae ATCC 10712]